MSEPLNWTTQPRAVSALKGCTYNPRRMSAAGKERLLGSLRKFNLVDIPVVNADDTILSGHQRVALLILEDRAAELIDVRVPNRMLTEEEAKEYMLQANNHAGEWDQGLLGAHFSTAIDTGALGPVMPLFLPPEPDPEPGPVNNPFDDKGITARSQYGVMVICAGEQEQVSVYEELTAAGHTCKVVVT